MHCFNSTRGYDPIHERVPCSNGFEITRSKYTKEQDKFSEKKG